MKAKISIIIPVYNSEKYLEECIISLLNQTLKECEFIFINDGSTDNSYNICKEYERKDGRIVLINQENRGVSTARNIGMTRAQGDYITFVDSDDYVDNKYIETLLSYALKTFMKSYLAKIITLSKCIVSYGLNTFRYNYLSNTSIPKTAIA